MGLSLFSFSSRGQRGVLRKGARETRRRRSEGTGAGHRCGVSQIRGGHEGTERPHENPGTCFQRVKFVLTRYMRVTEYFVFAAFIIPRDTRNIPLRSFSPCTL